MATVAPACSVRPVPSARTRLDSIDLLRAVEYPLCRWFAGVKRRRRDWWLSYV